MKFKKGDLVRFTQESESKNIGKKLRVVGAYPEYYNVECEDGIIMTDGETCQLAVVLKERAERELELIEGHTFKDIFLPEKLEVSERNPHNHGDLCDYWAIKREENNNYLCHAKRGRLTLDVWKSMNSEKYPERYLKIFNSQESAWDYIDEHSRLLDDGDVVVVPTSQVTGCV